MKKRVLSLLLALALALSLLPVPAFAAEAAEISDQAGLAALASGGGDYVLTRDITLTDWTPVTLSGGVTLDGNGHTVTLTGTALFQKINDGAVVKNLVLQGSVTSENSVGSVAVINNGVIRNCASYADVTYTGTGGSSWSPHYAAGLAGSASADSGTVANCLYAGTLSAGSAQLYGAIANNQFFVSGSIQTCVGVGCDRIGMTEGMSSHTEIAVGTNQLVADRAQFVPGDYTSHFNANLQEGDLSWSADDGTLTPRAGEEKPDPEATEEELAVLDAAIAAAAEVDRSVVYTAESWSAFSSALKTAQEVRGTDAPKQSKVTRAAAGLTAARTALTRRSLEAVDLSGQEVISITTVDELEYMQAGKYYRLEADITIGQYWFGVFNTMNSVLDGNGHTITLTGSTLWGGIGPNGVVQNLGILGAAQNSTNDTGAIAVNCEGLIVNCWSRAEVTSEGNNGIRKSTGGLAANLKSGGAIVNCYVAGAVTAKGSTGTGVAGALAGTSEGNTLIQNGYWLTGICDGAAGSAGGAVTACAARSREEFYSDAFLALLNSGRGENGRAWTLSDEGWPHLGQAGNFVPVQPAEVAYTAYEGFGSGTTVFSASQGLILSLADVLPGSGGTGGHYVGRFSYPGFDGEVAFVGQYAAGGQGGHKVFVSEEGELEVLAAGSLEIAIYEKASWSGTQYESELARFTVTVSDIEAGELRLVPTGEYVTRRDGGYEVAGSGVVTLRTEVLVDGVWKSAPSSLFTFEIDGSVFTTGGSTFYAAAPGVITVTAAGLGQTASVAVESTYVPVTSITPALSGTYEIHDRNANSDGLGNFLDLMLSHGAGTVIVEPENASYRDDWSLTSSNPEVAEYVSAFLRAVLPYKAGTVTLTAVSNDPGLAAPVTGASTITLRYFNPLTGVALEEEGLTVRENETIILPLTFTGSAGKEAYHVTEPGMLWSFSGDGEAEITRTPLGVIVGEEGGAEYCVANSEYKLTGLSAGTVTVTGTPVDQTGGAGSITFTVTVEPGEAEVPADTDQIVSEGIAGALAQVQQAYAGWQYQFGDEWAVFTLTRAGHPLTQAEISHYLDSVAETYAQPKNSSLKPTTLARVTLAVSVLGEDAADVKGIDFVDLLCNNRFIDDSTSNEAIWTLIALDCCAYTVPGGARWDREALMQEILSYQCANGAFSLGDDLTPNPDVTAMALQALAPYYETDEAVRAAVDAALDYLRGAMDRNCDYGSSETVAQVLIALTALGLDPLAEENGFVRSAARNLLTALDGYRLEDGGYQHLLTDGKSNSMATLQALQALVAYDRFVKGQTALYDLTEPEQPAAPGEGGASGGVQEPGQTPGGAPATGDPSSTAQMGAVMLLAALGFVLLARKKRRS